jgi:hypothetical protein
MIATEIFDTGMRPIPPFTQFPVVMPSTQDTNTLLDSYKSSSQEYVDLLEEVKAKFDVTGDQKYKKAVGDFEAECKTYVALEHKVRNTNRDVGHLWACSGFEQGLDWSLMLAPLRVIHNTTPRSAEMTKLTKRRWLPESPTVSSYSAEDIRAGKFVIKKGRSTDVTMGTLNVLRSMFFDNIRGKKVTFEGWHIAPESHDHVFSRPGDSGSWVLDMRGNWIGMIIAEIDGGALMLTVDKLIPDIERMTGARVGLP